MEYRYINSTLPEKYFPLHYCRLRNEPVFILFLFFALIIHTNAQPYSDKALIYKAIHYDLDICIDYENRKLKGICGLSVINTTEEVGKIIPLLIYRLMKVSSIKDENGNALVHTQKVLPFEDREKYQANYIEVIPAKSLLKGDSLKLIIEYDGYLFGYTETGMGYVRDKIEPEFTILRPDPVVLRSDETQAAWHIQHHRPIPPMQI